MNSPGYKWDAALIAGGKSRRFGQDKAFADWRGEPLYVVQLRTLMRLTPNRIWLSTNSEQSFPEHIDGVQRINDTIPEIGPIGAFKTVFESSEADRIFLLAVDMPLLGEDSIKKIVTSQTCTVPKINNRWEPLSGIYPRRDFLELIDDQIQSNEYSLQRLLDRAENNQLIVSFAIEEADRILYTNLNTEEEYLEIQQGMLYDCTQKISYQRGANYSDSKSDYVAREEPLELQVNRKSVAVMMRTPGHDDELITGFLFTEGIIKSQDQILAIENCPDVDPESRGNTLNVTLHQKTDLSELTRHVFTSSSCGVCGKATIESVFLNFPPIEKAPDFDPEVILALPEKLRSNQETFEKTGGLHASALFTLNGELILAREDVGRHNALDKVIGATLRDQTDVSESILLVSGRISFELMQKALATKIPIVAGISAPSSLAVDLARQSGVVLIGFLRNGGFNLYTVKE